MRDNLLKVLQQKTPSPAVRGFLWLALSYLCATIFFTTTKILLNNMTTADFFSWWYGIALIFHSLYGLFTPSIAFGDMERSHRRLLLLYVLLDTTGTYAFFAAIRMMDPSASSFLNQSQIIFTLFLGYIVLKEALDKREAAAAGIIILGVTVMTYKSASVPLAGTLCMVFANFTAASNFVIVRKIGCHVGTLTFARIRTTTLFILFTGYNLYTTGAVTVPPAGILAVAVFGSFFGPFLNIIAMYKALEYIPAGKLALLKSLQPIFVLIAAFVVLKTFPGFRESLGGIIVVIGCMFLAYFHARHALDIRRPLRQPR